MLFSSFSVAGSREEVEIIRSPRELVHSSTTLTVDGASSAVEAIINLLLNRRTFEHRMFLACLSTSACTWNVVGLRVYIPHIYAAYLTRCEIAHTNLQIA